MKWWKRLRTFLRNVARRPHAPQGRVEDTPELEFEVERARGMRGD